MSSRSKRSARLWTTIERLFELQDGATLIACSQFGFWGDAHVPCIMPRGTARPERRQISIGEITGPVRLKVVKIRGVGAIDTQYEYIYAEAQPGRKRYVAELSSLINRVGS